MASGALTLGAAIGLHLAQIACNRRGGIGEWLGIAALGAMTIVLARVVLDAAGVWTGWERTRRVSSRRRFSILRAGLRPSIGIGHRGAFIDLLHHHIRRSPGAERSAVVQCRSVRMDADSVPGAGGGPGGNRGSEPLLRHASNRSDNQPDQRLLALGVCDEGRQGKDLALSWSRCMAGRRRGVVGSRSAPRAGRPRQLASYHRGRGKKRAGLSPRRKRVGSWRRPASGNPLFRIEPLARIAR